MSQCWEPSHYPQPDGGELGEAHLHAAGRVQLVDGVPAVVAGSACEMRRWPGYFYDEDDIVIINGDCRDVLREVRGDVLITDPDYGVNMDYGREPLTSDEADTLLVYALNEADVTSGQGLVFWSGSWRRIEAFRTLIQSTPWQIKHFGIWYKPNGAGASGNGLARRFETWFWIEDGTGKKNGEWSRLPDCISINRVHRGMDEASAHPSQKPEELMRRFVRFFSQPGDTILDPFMGSGTTLRAAKDLGRKAIGIELNEDYCKIARDRMRQAVLL